MILEAFLVIFMTMNFLICDFELFLVVFIILNIWSFLRFAIFSGLYDVKYLVFFTICDF